MNNLLWSLKAKLYQALRHGVPFNFILAGENKKLNRLVASLDLKTKRVIDLGTGTGNAIQFLNDAQIVLGIDVTFQMLQAAKNCYPEAKLIQADASQVPAKSNSVDVITAIGLSEYIEDINLLFSEFVRLLKNGGYLVFTFSPPAFWTSVRLLLGHRIYPRYFDEILLIAKKSRLHLVKKSRTFMQEQILFQIK